LIVIGFKKSRNSNMSHAMKYAMKLFSFAVVALAAVVIAGCGAGEDSGPKEPERIPKVPPPLRGKNGNSGVPGGAGGAKKQAPARQGGAITTPPSDG
jgi:hypothetical protein